MGGDYPQSPSAAFDVRIERAARLATAEGEVDRAHFLDRVAREHRVAEAPRRRIEGRADRKLPVGRYVDVGAEIVPAGAAERHLLQGNHLGVEFAQDAAHALRIVAAVRADPLV